MGDRWRAFLQGMASVFSLWPPPPQSIREVERTLRESYGVELDDSKAIASDWKAAGDDLRKATKQK